MLNHKNKIKRETQSYLRTLGHSLWTFGSRKSRRLVPEVPALANLAAARLRIFARRKSQWESGVLGAETFGSLQKS